MLTRRSFLLGAGAGVAGLAAGTEVVGRDRVLRKLGLTHSPDLHVPPGGWPVEAGTMPSRAMGHDVRWVMARPPGGDPDGVIVCLHGHGNDERFPFDAVHLHDVVAAEGERLAVAAVAGGVGSYWHKRASGTDAGAMLADEFVPYVRQRLGVADVALLGWSMGGYGALLAAERHAERYIAAVAASPALWTRAADTAPGAFDGPADYAANDVFAGLDALRSLPVRVDCGTSDPFAKADRAFVAKLGSDVTSSFPAGGHDVAFWRSVAPAQVRFVATALR